MLQKKIDELSHQLGVLLTQSPLGLYRPPESATVSNSSIGSITTQPTPFNMPSVCPPSLSATVSTLLPELQSVPGDGDSLLASVSSLAAVTTPSPSTSLATETSRFLVLADGTALWYSVDEIPDPPTTTFKDLDFARLDRMWDDAQTCWDKSSTLIIGGRSIAVKYWPEVYRYGKPRQWEGIKGKWGNWQVCYLLND